MRIRLPTALRPTSAVSEAENPKASGVGPPARQVRAAADLPLPVRRSARDVAAILDRVYATLPREWTAKEGAHCYPNYRHYLRAIASCSDDIQLERSGTQSEVGLDLLDIGLSMGVVGYACSLMGMRVTGVDDERNEWHPLLQPLRKWFGVSYAGYNALTNQLPFETSSFDIVNSNDMIEHIHGSPKRMLNESYRVLRRGGRIVITTPNLSSLHNRLLLLLGGSVHASIQDWYHSPQWHRPVFTGHVREYTPGELRYVLGEAGFQNVRVMPFNSFPGSVAPPPADASELDYSRWFSYLKDAPFYEREFHLRGKRDVAYVAHSLITMPFRGMRRELLAVARKD
ncbi:MAG TPA: methyltransferase domain-containing protein [Myxococcota bacterium]|nr:methyltransferase domain-containing protein [Myxococcota bacterium]